MITKEKILKRPERLEGLPEQARHVSSYHLYEDEARELTLYFEDRLPTIGMGVDEMTLPEKYLLRHLRMIHEWGTFNEFVEDFASTQLGRLLEQMTEKTKLNRLGIEKDHD